MRQTPSILRPPLLDLTDIAARGRAAPPRGRSRLAAVSLWLAAAGAAPGCVDPPPPPELAVAAAGAVTTPSVDPTRMFCNGKFMFGFGDVVIGYSQVRFQYSHFGISEDITASVTGSGEFIVQPAEQPLIGDVVRVTWSGPGVTDAGCNFTFAIPSGGAVFSFAEMGCRVAPRLPNVVLNEILANEPGSATAGEFVELVNLGDGGADLSGWTLSDAISVRHTFAAGTALAAGRALVVFGGAAAIPVGLTNAIAASSGALGLNNTGDTVSLRAADGTARGVVTYGSDLSSADGVSMNLSPEGTASGQYVLHTALSPAPSSPGVRTNLAAW
jgi:hypothetical protein